MSRRALLVEGYADTLLIRGILNAANIADVDVFPPKQLGGPSDGISNVIKLLPVMLGKIQSGDFDHFGILVDADFTGINGGFAARQQQLSGPIVNGGYVRQANPPFGDIFVHASQIPLHVAILPDHANDGMAETVLRGSVSAGTRQRF